MGHLDQRAGLTDLGLLRQQTRNDLQISVGHLLPDLGAPQLVAGAFRADGPGMPTHRVCLITVRRVAYILKAAATRAGLAGTVSPHSLRHARAPEHSRPYVVESWRGISGGRANGFSSHAPKATSETTRCRAAYRRSIARRTRDYSPGDWSLRNLGLTELVRPDRGLTRDLNASEPVNSRRLPRQRAT